MGRSQNRQNKRIVIGKIQKKNSANSRQKFGKYQTLNKQENENKSANNKLTNTMNLQEIKNTVDNGIKVFWINKRYQVIKDRPNKYLIVCDIDKSFIGLTWLDNVTLNGKEEEFFVE